MTETATSLLTALTLLLGQFLTGTPEPAPSATGMASSQTLAEQNHAEVVQTAVAAEPDRFWSAPFVLADREAKEVWVWGQATGMTPGDPLEFFVISPQSGHDYEALMIGFAAPSDIHAALEEIGLEPGAPVNPDDHRFWPRGARVTAEIEWKPEGKAEPVRMPVERTVLENGTEMKPLPWVFTGAPMLPSPDDRDVMVYGADVFSPNSVASTFNLRNTVFDLPLQGSKTEVYGKFIRNPEPAAAEGTPMLLRLSPADPALTPTDIDLTLNFSDGGLSVGGDLDLEVESLEELGAALNERDREIHYLTIDFGDDMSLGAISREAHRLKLLERHVESVRIEPPVPGQVFFQAFTPDPRFRDRTKRPSQPVELHLTSDDDGSVRGTVMELTEIWGETRTPAVVEERVAVDTADDWISYLDEKETHVPVLFLYADRETGYGRAREWVGPVLGRFPVVFVYLNGDQ